MAFEWVAGLFQSDNREMRGLSGDHAHSVALDHANPYYNFRLRHHKAEGDLIADALATPEDASVLAAVRARVKKLCERFPLYDPLS